MPEAAPTHPPAAVPGLTAEDLTPCDKVGIRPQLVNVKERRLALDFVVEKAEASLHVLNAISPAFTASFAFAAYLADRCGERDNSRS